MNVGIADYEIRPYNKWCYQIYRVMPEGYETRSKIGKAADGRYLVPIEKYPTTIRQAVGIIEVLMEHDAEVSLDLSGAIRQLVEIAARVESAAMWIEKAANADAGE